MMKILALAAVLLAWSAASAEATTDSFINSRGVYCQPGGGGVACALTSGSGYGVAISRGAVIVMNFDTGRQVFTRYQPQP
jgi:hypothetical protein